MKNFYTITDVAEMLGVSRTTAQRRIKSMNDQLEEQDYYTEPGKVPVELFHEKYPYLKKEVS